MKSVKNLIIILIIFMVSGVCNYSYAQTAPATMTNMTAQVAPAEKKLDAVQQPTEAKSGLCACLKGAMDAIQKAYVSIEEDEWPTAIKSTKDAISTIGTVSKTCTCPETIAYQKVAEAYLKYAEGGNHLDGAEEPDCPYATKLYSDAITLLDAYIPKITNAAVKGNAEDIQSYVKEEKEFVDEECGGTQTKESSNSAAETKEKK